MLAVHEQFTSEEDNHDEDYIEHLKSDSEEEALSEEEPDQEELPNLIAEARSMRRTNLDIGFRSGINMQTFDSEDEEDEDYTSDNNLSDEEDEEVEEDLETITDEVKASIINCDLASNEKLAKSAKILRSGKELTGDQDVVDLYEKIKSLSHSDEMEIQ